MSYKTVRIPQIFDDKLITGNIVLQNKAQNVLQNKINSIVMAIRNFTFLVMSNLFSYKFPTD